MPIQRKRVETMRTNKLIRGEKNKKNRRKGGGGVIFY